MAGALDGIRVLDLAQGSFGYAGRLLAGFGADVIKVEPRGGDPLRAWPPFAADHPDPERGARHLHLDGAKRSMVVDLDAREGQALLRRLVREADALVESFTPGHLAARGLDYDRLVESRPDLVMVSITHFGQDGPYAQYAGGEIVDAALGGYLYLTGDPDREPVKPYDDLVLQHAAVHGAVAVMAGITHRELIGEGDHFDVAASEAALFLLGGMAQTYHFDGRVSKRVGARLTYANPLYPYPSTIRPCRGGYVHAHSNNRHIDLLAALMQGVGMEALLDRPMGNADAIDEAMDRWMAEKDKFEVVRLAQEMRLPFTEVLTPDEVIRDPHLEARGFFVELEHPAAPGVRQPGAAAMLTGTPWRVARAPVLAEHTDEVLGDVLGLDRAAIDALRRDGVIA
ncbi:MAG: CoA transferase [Chloroflexi bacterium]|nr:CoA transferase [Chloroflexota bacterium]